MVQDMSIVWGEGQVKELSLSLNNELLTPTLRVTGEGLEGCWIPFSAENTSEEMGGEEHSPLIGQEVYVSVLSQDPFQSYLL